MRSLIRWEPANLLGEVERIFSPFFLARRGAGNGDDLAWAPAVELSEKNGSYLVKTELPGVEKKGLSVAIEDGVITIKAEKKEEKKEEKKNYYCSELRYGAFYRSFELPSSVKADQAKATFKDGVLEINIPKREEPEKKAATVKIE